MKTPHTKQLIWMMILLVVTAAVSAMTLEELVESYDYSFYNGTINVTSTSNVMSDTNSNTVPDQLSITLTTDQPQGTYDAYIDLDDPNGLIIRGATKTLTSGDRTITIDFPSELLSQQKYNYSVRIYNNDGLLVFERHNIETNNLGTYEEGISLVSADDQNVGDTSIKIDLTLDSSTARTENVTAVLRYDDTEISVTEEKSIASRINTISLHIDNETIKDTHYNGQFLIAYVVVGEKILTIDQLTSSYNYEDFAQTSYIRSIASGLSSNTSATSLDVNVTLEVLEAGTYTIEGEFYDIEDLFIGALSKEVTLSVGTHVITVPVNGSDIYATYSNGPYYLSTLIITKENATVDSLTNAHVTEKYRYNDFLPPPRPDLIVDVTAYFDASTGITHANVTVSNIGPAPAFNIFTETIDTSNNTFEEVLAFLDANASHVYSYALENTTNDTVVLAFTDLQNTIDEENEFNNVGRYQRELVPAVAITSLNATSMGSGVYLFDIALTNTGEVDLEAVNVSVDFGDGSVTSDIAVNMSPSETQTLSFSHAYTTDGGFTFNIVVESNVSGTIVSSQDSTHVAIGEAVEIVSFAPLSVLGSRVVFEAVLENTGAEVSNGLLWNFTPEPSVSIPATHALALSPGETVRVYIIHDYSALGAYEPHFSITNQNIVSDATTAVNITVLTPESLSVSDLDVIAVEDTLATMSFTITNNGSIDLSAVAWELDLGGETLTSQQSVALAINQTLQVLVNHDFGATGNYSVVATARDGETSASQQRIVGVVAPPPPVRNISVSSPEVLLLDGTQATIIFSIENTGEIALDEVYWALESEGIVLDSDTVFDLDVLEKVSVAAEHDFVSPGNYTFTAYASSNDTQDQKEGSISIAPPPPGSLSIPTLHPVSVNGTLVEVTFVVENNGSSPLHNVTWEVDFNGSLVSSPQSFSLDVGQTESVLLDHDFVHPGNYTIIATAMNEHSSAIRELLIGLQPPLSPPVENVSLTSTKVLSIDGTKVVVEFLITNTGEVPLENVQWGALSGDTLFFGSGISFTLGVAQTVTVIIEHDYVTYGNYEFLAIAWIGPAFGDEETILIELEEPTNATLQLSSLEIVSVDALKTELEFLISNTGTTLAEDVEWTLELDGSTLYSTEPFNLEAAEQARVFVVRTFDEPGDYKATLTARAVGLLPTQRTGTITLPAIDISNLVLLHVTGTQATFEWTLKNYDSQTHEVVWFFEGVGSPITNVHDVFLEPNQTMVVSLRQDFQNEGIYEVITSVPFDEARYTFAITDRPPWTTHK